MRFLEATHETHRNLDNSSSSASSLANSSFFSSNVSFDNFKDSDCILSKSRCNDKILLDKSTDSDVSKDSTSGKSNNCTCSRKLCNKIGKSDKAS